MALICISTGNFSTIVTRIALGDGNISGEMVPMRVNGSQAANRTGAMSGYR